MRDPTAQRLQKKYAKQDTTNQQSIAMGPNVEMVTPMGTVDSGRGGKTPLTAN